MNEPFKYTITPADRATYIKWLTGMSALYGVLTLVAVGGVLISEHFVYTRTQTATASITAPAPPAHRH
jgi:hypothetical protein